MAQGPRTLFEFWHRHTSLASGRVLRFLCLKFYFVFHSMTFCLSLGQAAVLRCCAVSLWFTFRSDYCRPCSDLASPLSEARRTGGDRSRIIASRKSSCVFLPCKHAPVVHRMLSIILCGVGLWRSVGIGRRVTSVDASASDSTPSLLRLSIPRPSRHFLYWSNVHLDLRNVHIDLRVFHPSRPSVTATIDTPFAVASPDCLSSLPSPPCRPT